MTPSMLLIHQHFCHYILVSSAPCTQPQHTLIITYLDTIDLMTMDTHDWEAEEEREKNVHNRERWIELRSCTNTENHTMQFIRHYI